MRNPHTSFAASRRLPNNRDIAIYLLGRTHKPAFCKRGSVRFAPKATEVLRCREVTRCARTGCEQVQQDTPHEVPPNLLNDLTTFQLFCLASASAARPSKKHWVSCVCSIVQLARSASGQSRRGGRHVNARDKCEH